MDIRRWITPADDALMQTTWAKVQRWHRSRLPAAGRRRSDLCAKAVWHYLVEKVTYEADEKRKDHWQFPEETLARKSGDCEDKSFLAASLLLAAGIPEDRVRVVVGAVVRSQDPRRRSRFSGHAWPIYRGSSGRWNLLETDLQHLPRKNASRKTVISKRPAGIEDAAFLPMDRYADDGSPLQYVPLFCVGSRSVWTVEETEPGRVQAAQRFQPDWAHKPSFQSLWKRESRLATYGTGRELLSLDDP